MKVIISNQASKEEIEKSIRPLKKHPKTKGKSPADFKGALKGVFGDGMSYQSTVRKDWDGLPG